LAHQLLAHEHVTSSDDAACFADACWLALSPEVRLVLDEPELRPRLATAMATAGAAWDGFVVAPARFAAYVATRASDAAALAELLTPATLAELYLACACADGDAAAIASLEARYFPSVTGALSRMRLSSAAVDEVLQWLRGHLFLPLGNGRRGIAGFRGVRGTLAGWLGVIAVREGCRVLQRGRRHAGNGDDELMRLSGSEHDAERQYARKWSQDAFMRAFVGALAELTDREKSLLRLHYLDGVTLEQLATLYRKDRATAVRWLAAARQRLFDRTRAQLVEQLGVPFSDCDSIIRSAREQLELTFHRLFAAQGTGVNSIEP
jgi:RNA polymerase sigma-70 factor (ECF subfamily)